MTLPLTENRSFWLQLKKNKKATVRECTMTEDAKAFIAELLQGTGPIEDHIKAVAAERAPSLAIAICTAKIDEAAPRLREAVEKAASGEALLDTEKTLAFRALYILGGTRDHQSFPLLLKLLRRPHDEVEQLLGDVITEDLAKIAAGMFDGNAAAALFDAITDTSLDEFIRDALMGAATFLCWDGRIERDLMVRFLEQFYEERRAADGDYTWVGWLEAVAHLGLRELAPRVYAAWDEGRVPAGVLDRKHFEQDLAAAEQAPYDLDRFKNANLGYIDDVLEALQWTLRWSQDADEWERDTDFDMPDLSGMPVTNAWRHVGRNDPCPCGSGKKAKKCCMPN
jgi:hypothetical protein